MDKLKDIQDKLKTRPAYQLDIMDVVTDKTFQRAVNQEYLNKHHGGNLGNFLQSLKEKGLQKIQLVPRIKNGNATKPGGAYRTVDFTGTPKNTATAAPSFLAMPAASGLNGAFGLGMPEILDGYAAKRENEQLKEQLRQLQQDFKEERESKRKWREKAEKADRENERYEYKEEIQREPSVIDKILSGLAENPASIPALIGAFKGGIGLGNPSPHQEAQIVNPLEGYTEMQTALCEMIAQCPDSFCNDLATLIARVSEEDESFIRELKKLLETPTLKKVESNG